MSVSSAKAAETAAKRALAIKLRLAGISWDAIATRCGYSSAAAACRDVGRAKAKALRGFVEDAEADRALEIERLDRLQAGLWTAATNGDPRSADTVLRVIAERTKLKGINVPPDVEARIEGEVTARIGVKMATVWGSVLRGLGLTPEQAALVPVLMDQAIAAFTGQPARQALQASAVAGNPVADDPGDDPDTTEE